MLNSWVANILNSIGNARMKAETQIGSLSLQIEKERNPMTALNSLLTLIAHKLPEKTENQCPIVFIDEANRLRTLLRDREHGQSALESFFEWLVLHTKE